MAVERPCAETRYGTPQSSTNTIIENWVPMWPKKPSRVPGRIQTCAQLPADRPHGHVGAGAQVFPGALRTTAITSTTASALPAAAVLNATDQPALCSSAANGIADSICPAGR